jgi:hypothetical protein
MWVWVSGISAQDLGIELAVSTIWQTKLDPCPEQAREVDPATPLALDLIADPLSVLGPVYEVVARVVDHERTGRYLDTGLVKLESQHLFAYQGLSEDRDNSDPRPLLVGTVLSFRSAIEAGPGYFFDASDPSVGDWEVRQIYVRKWSLVPDGSPNSFRRDPSTLRLRPIQRMQMGGDVNPFDGDGPVSSDYLLEVST